MLLFVNSILKESFYGLKATFMVTSIKSREKSVKK
nr:MAG TPA: hypothetical protein [Caudoviricetes sp.]